MPVPVQHIFFVDIVDKQCVCTSDNKMIYSIDLHRANYIYNCEAVQRIQAKCMPTYYQNHVHISYWG